MTSSELFYARDLAAIHAKHHEALARAAAEVLLSLMPTAGRVLDLGCGAGPLSFLLTADGHEVYGIDLSAELLSIARQRVPTGRFEKRDILSTDFGDVDAIAAIGEVVNYATATGGPSSLENLFRRARESLPVRGQFLFDCAGPKRHRKGEYVWSEQADSFVAMQAIAKDDIITRKIVTFTQRDNAWEKSNEVHRLHTYEPTQIFRMLEKAGFEVQHLSGYGEFELPDGLHPYLATAL
ncbi:trans-aconitate 2-methyltransferase [Sulfitobacter sp. M368]|uniref:class I SAM-dependent methyltransferase n=1 Tax=Sulfitobacter sp. M368 TaxID=2867021 RepID=UPI0021A46634|nr:class I SAM-dependent methyltransferase [Sulfitobacter sp. M368]UWR13797.1 class I SAM-dependent methyltransferase [Sulfitobacter sp. M368]